MKLHLGCGIHILEGYENIDKYQGAPVELDLEDGKLPYGANSVEEIRAIDVLEHIRNLIPLMNECWRVLTGEFIIEVPRFPSDAAVSDPTHVRFFTEETFKYFTNYTHLQKLYGVKQWEEVSKQIEDNRIYITLKPVK